MDAEDLKSSADGLLKASDHKNHLDAIPEDEDNQPSKTDQIKKKSPQQQELELRHGPLTAEKLQRDYQVQRALEILIGYDVFKNLKG